MLVVIAFGSNEYAFRSAAAPAWPYCESSCRTAGRRCRRDRYSAMRNASPWSVGTIRKTFGRVCGSTSSLPPWWTMPIGTPAAFARCHDASTPVPSSTIATAPAAIACRTLATAVCAERPSS